VCGFLPAAPTLENPRWVNAYFEKVYAVESPYFVQGTDWMDSLLRSRERWASAPESARTTRAADVLWADFCQAYPMQSDWLIQDRPDGVLAPDWGEKLVGEDLSCELVEGLIARALAASVFQRPVVAKPQVADFSDVAAGLAEYQRICLLRRALFLDQVPEHFRKWVFVKLPHTVISGANHYSYTESLSDHPFYRTFQPGAELCLLTLDNANSISTKSLLTTTSGSLRDPEVRFDAKRLLFAWRKSGDQDDYHLYEMQLGSGEIRQLTEGLGHADYEAIYAPGGDIIFNSTRCVQSIDCDSNVVSNLYTCDKDGRFMRRLGFDQVSVNYPKLLPDGRVIYTRWEYNDRSQQWPQPLFQMNPDGTAQTEYYGNNSWFPTTILHARPIADSRKLIVVLSGHHTHQKGKLAIIDVAAGNQEAQGVTLVAPQSEPEVGEIDMWGTEGDQFKYPYAINENLYVVSVSAYEGFRGSRGHARTLYARFKPFNGRTLASPFWLYLVNRAGERELLAADERFSCLQAVPLVSRKRPRLKPSTVDYRKKDGIFFLQDIYHGQGLKGIERGTIRGIRVVELLYRHYPVGMVRLKGPGHGSVSRTPVALNNGSYDAKRVLGEARVYADGSACFKVPARTPVYFQAIDHNGHVAQTMRSWATLQPGETFGCVGCHETKYDSPPQKLTLALQHGPQELTPFYGPPRPFSYPREIQPIWDKHCVSCHNGPRAGAVPSPATTATIRASQSCNRPSAMNDGHEPKNSGDLKVPRFTFWPHKGTEEWVEYEFPEAMKVSSTGVYWFDTGPDGPWCRKPDWWKLIGRNGDDWHELGSVSGSAVCKDTYDRLRFDPVTVRQLRIVAKLPDGWSGGILEWLVERTPKSSLTTGDEKPFSLRGDEDVVDVRAKRRFSDSYVYFCSVDEKARAPVDKYGPNPMVNWMNVQEVPTVLPPYHAGAAKSRLIDLLEDGHEGVKLSQEEMDRIACWIDLLVPYCGDYRESHAWTPEELAEYEHRVRKRAASEAREHQDIQAYVKQLESKERRALR
jgi:hypothetical protein